MSDELTQRSWNSRSEPARDSGLSEKISVTDTPLSRAGSLLQGVRLPAEDLAAVGGAGGGELFRADVHQLRQSFTNRR